MGKIEKWCAKTLFFLFLRQNTEFNGTFTSMMLACIRATQTEEFGPISPSIGPTHRM